MTLTSTIAIALLMAAAAVVAPIGARASTLIVPLTGGRHRAIEPQTLFHTLFSDFFFEPDGTVYVQTGDIPAMWLRDSSAQTIPYIRFEPAFPALRNRIAGVIERDAKNVLADPYANAFQASYHVWERKWEVDSLAWPVLLAWVYWQTTSDRSIFTNDLHRALRQIVATYECEERHARCSHYVYPYRVFTRNAYAANTGLIWSAFRPSDNPVYYRFNIPQNALAAVAMRETAALASIGYGDAKLASAATELGERVETGVLRYGRIYDAAHGGWMYAYEVDGLGHALLIDDANIPDLLTLPYIGWCSAFDPTYLTTRNFVLSTANPYYYRGRYASGLGSDHTPVDNVWPLAIIGRALTSTSSLEIATAITTLAQTDGMDGLIHESFYVGGYWRYTRSDFGWANALYAELLFRTIAGQSATPFVEPETMLPFEMRTQTPTSVPFVAQLENESSILTALAQLLAASDARR
ncbi:MAG: glycoside hydrolase family 125 protein [Candidatus Tyrphobacter sp.]